jgi:CMP-2-keto-3-deoxyoctulosonic acid synthetase
VQGDEPFINKEPLEKVIEVFKNDADKKVDLASLMREITNEEDINTTTTTQNQDTGEESREHSIQESV